MLQKARLMQLPQLAGTATEGNHLAYQPDAAPRYQQPITAEQNFADTEARGACDAQPTSQERFWCPDANCPNHCISGSFQGWLRWDNSRRHCKERHPKHANALLEQARAASQALLRWCPYVGCPQHSASGFEGYLCFRVLQTHLKTHEQPEAVASLADTDNANAVGLPAPNMIRLAESDGIAASSVSIPVPSQKQLWCPHSWCSKSQGKECRGYRSNESLQRHLCKCHKKHGQPDSAPVTPEAAASLQTPPIVSKQLIPTTQPPSNAAPSSATDDAAAAPNHSQDRTDSPSAMPAATASADPFKAVLPIQGRFWCPVPDCSRSYANDRAFPGYLPWGSLHAHVSREKPHEDAMKIVLQHLKLLPTECPHAPQQSNQCLACGHHTKQATSQRQRLHKQMLQMQRLVVQHCSMRIICGAPIPHALMRMAWGMAFQMKKLYRLVYGRLTTASSQTRSCRRLTVCRHYL